MAESALERERPKRVSGPGLLGYCFAVAGAWSATILFSMGWHTIAWIWGVSAGILGILLLTDFIFYRK